MTFCYVTKCHIATPPPTKLLLHEEGPRIIVPLTSTDKQSTVYPYNHIYLYIWLYEPRLLQKPYSAEVLPSQPAKTWYI